MVARLFKYWSHSKNILMRVPEPTLANETNFHLQENSCEESPAPRPKALPSRRLILKRNRVQGSRMKGGLKAAKHDSFSTCENSNVELIERSTKMAHSDPRTTVELSKDEEPRSEQKIQEKCPQCESLNLEFQLPELVGIREEIHEHMLSLESKYVPGFIRHSDDQIEQNRAKLASWIFCVCARFGFRTQTAFLAINILDRTLGLRPVGIRDLALLGVTALFMSSKYQQVKVPRVEDFVKLFSNQYGITRTSLLNLESTLLLLLQFNLSFCSPLVFIGEEGSSRKLPQEVIQRAEDIAKQMTVSSGARYWPASQLASYSIQTAISEMKTGKDLHCQSSAIAHNS